MDGPEPDFLPLVTLLHEGFPDGSVSKEPLSKAGATGDMGSILGLRRSSREGHGNPLQHSCLKNSWTDEPGGLQSIGLQRVGHN